MHTWKFAVSADLPARAFMKIAGRMTFEGGGDAPPPPDYTPIANANAESSRLAAQAAQDDLAFRKQQYADLKPAIDRQMALGASVSEEQLKLMRETNERADSQWEQYMRTFRPIEEQMAREAMEYGSAEDQERAARSVEADIGAGAARARASTARQLSSMGVAPTSGRFAAFLRDADISLAGMSASGANAARTQVKDKGIALRAGAASFGRNLPNWAGQAAGTSVSAGNSAANNSGAGILPTIQGATYVSGATPNIINAYNTGIQGNLGLAGLMSSDYRAASQAAAADSSGMWGAIGTAAGIAGAIAL